MSTERPFIRPIVRNLPALREIGFAANRRLLRVEHLSHDSLIGDDALDALITRTPAASTCTLV